MKSYRDLRVCKLSYELAVKVREMTLKPPWYELYEEGSQVRKSSKGFIQYVEREWRPGK